MANSKFRIVIGFVLLFGANKQQNNCLTATALYVEHMHTRTQQLSKSGLLGLRELEENRFQCLVYSVCAVECQANGMRFAGKMGRWMSNISFGSIQLENLSDFHLTPRKKREKCSIVNGIANIPVKTNKTL